MLATLMNRVANNLNIPKSNVYLWTDSSVVITWLSSHASRWKTFVAHRVNEIQKLFDTNHWYHVRTHENPADVASRGCFPSELVNNHLWFYGLPWLLKKKDQWPKLQLNSVSDINLEEKQLNQRVNLIETKPKELEMLLRYSSLLRLLKATAYLFRFIKFLKDKKTIHSFKKFVTVEELKYAKNAWIKYDQERFFTDEIKSLTQDKAIETVN